MNGFNTKVNELVSLYTITEDHAGCYLCNYEDDYICHKFNGGCKNAELCKRISESECVR